MDKENYGRSDDVEEKPNNRQPRPTRRNTKKQHQGTRMSKLKAVDSNYLYFYFYFYFYFIFDLFSFQSIFKN